MTTLVRTAIISVPEICGKISWTELMTIDHVTEVCRTREAKALEG